MAAPDALPLAATAGGAPLWAVGLAVIVMLGALYLTFGPARRDKNE
jgi:hypothetical protein